MKDPNTWSWWEERFIRLLLLSQYPYRRVHWDVCVCWTGEMLSVGLLYFNCVCVCVCFGQMVWVAVNVLLFWRTFVLYYSGAQYYYLHKMLGVRTEFMCLGSVSFTAVCDFFDLHDKVLVVFVETECVWEVIIVLFYTLRCVCWVWGVFVCSHWDMSLTVCVYCGFVCVCVQDLRGLCVEFDRCVFVFYSVRCVCLYVLTVCWCEMDRMSTTQQCESG